MLPAGEARPPGSGCLLLVPIVFQRPGVLRNGLLKGVNSWSAPCPQGAAPTLGWVCTMDPGLPISRSPRALAGPAALSGPENHSSYPPARVASCLSFYIFWDAKMPNVHLARAVMSRPQACCHPQRGIFALNSCTSLSQTETAGHCQLPLESSYLSPSLPSSKLRSSLHLTWVITTSLQGTLVPKS